MWSIDPRPSTNQSTSLKSWFIISGDGCTSVRAYVSVQNTLFFKLVLWFIGSLYDSSLVNTLFCIDFINITYSKSNFSERLSNPELEYNLWIILLYMYGLCEYVSIFSLWRKGPFFLLCGQIDSPVIEQQSFLISKLDLCRRPLLLSNHLWIETAILACISYFTQ